jgi:tetratricopeptide (TPR) repeat protein
MHSFARFAIAAVLAAAGARTGAAPLAAQLEDPRASHEAIQHYRAGKDALATERYPQAEEEFRAAVRLDPLLVGAHHGLGQTMMATRRYDEAVTAFVAARDAFKRNQELAATHEMAVQRRLDEQIKALQDDNRTAQRAASGPNAQRVAAAISRNEDQIKTLQNLRRRSSQGPLPTPHWLSFALGSAYFRSDDLVSAEKEYRAALAQKPDLGEGHLNLGVVCMMTGRLDEAEREVALAEKAGIRVPPALKEDIQKGRAAKP